MAVSQQGSGEQRGIASTRGTDGKGGDRNAGGHLHDRQQRVETIERLRLHGHSEYRQRSLRCQHARQVGRTARAGDDGAQAARPAASSA